MFCFPFICSRFSVILLGELNDHLLKNGCSLVLGYVLVVLALVHLYLIINLVYFYTRFLEFCFRSDYIYFVRLGAFLTNEMFMIVLLHTF